MRVRPVVRSSCWSSTTSACRRGVSAAVISRRCSPIASIATLKKSRDLRLKKDQNDARLEIVKAFTEILQVEERADRASRDKVRTLKRDVPEGSEEWDILQKRYYGEELKKFGIDTSK